MLHARQDYNRRIQDSENLIPDGEPVFLLRGQDVHAVDILERYVTLVKREGADHDKTIVSNCLGHIAAIKKWQEENGSKNPDMCTSDSVYTENGKLAEKPVEEATDAPPTAEATG